VVRLKLSEKPAIDQAAAFVRAYGAQNEQKVNNVE
jgi:hypothetical protein